MECPNCGKSDEYNSRFCTNCGQPLNADAAPGPVKPLPFLKRGLRDRRSRALVISIAAAAVLLAVLVLVLALSANPVAGRWYAQDGSELFFLQNGKGMTVSSGDGNRVHYMYALGYREPGYIEGEIYNKDGGGSSWFYIYDGKLEWDGRYYYRRKPASVPAALN